MIKWLLHHKQYKRIACLMVLAVLLGMPLCCIYWYGQWQDWKSVNDQICSYDTDILFQDHLKEREQTLKQWQHAGKDNLDIVQHQASIYGLQIISFYASPQEKGEYEIEMTGSYGSYIYFFNALEQSHPWICISLVQMEKQDDHISAIIKI